MSHTSELSKKYGISISVKSNGNLWVTPKDKITDEIRELIKENKSEIKEELADRGKKRVKVESRQGRSSDLPMPFSKRVLMGDLAKQLIEKRVPKFFIDAFQKQLHTDDHGGCGCKTMQARMNDVGPASIDDNREEYVKHFRKQIGKIPLSSLIPDSWKNSAAERFIEELMDEVKPERYVLPSDTIVITATDQRFFGGAYFLAWTLLHRNNCRLRVYDLGIDRSSRMYKDMRSWGVEFKKMKRQVSLLEYDGWQTLNKPRYIMDAMQRDEMVLWLDSDVAVSGDLSAMVAQTRAHTFVPDHGAYSASSTNKNPDELYDVMPGPAKIWGPGNSYPCAGILGFCTSRDFHLVNEWNARIAMADSYGVLDKFKFFDQGVFQDVYDGILVDGHTWNNLQTIRSGSVAEVFGQLSDEGRAVLFHYGGDVKPWFDWKPMRWPDPRYVKERHDRAD